MLDHAHSHTDFVLHRVLKELKVSYTKDHFRVIHVSPEQVFDITKKYPTPDTVTLKKLSADDVPTIAKTRPEYEADCVRLLVERNPNYGIYDRITGELLAWSLISIDQSFFSVHANESVSHCGFENILTAALAQDRAQQGKGSHGLVSLHGKMCCDILYEGLEVGFAVTAVTEAKKHA